MVHLCPPRIAGLVLAALALVLPAAAYSAEVEMHTFPLSGFLGDYSDLSLHTAKKRSGMLLYVREEGTLGQYEAFLIEPPLIYLHPEAEARGVDPEELAMLARTLREEVIDELRKGGYQVVEEAGPGVLRLRGAITDAVPVEPAKNVGASAVGVAAGVGLLMPRLDLGGASIEVEMLDGQSGERVAAIVAERSAHRFGGKIKGAKRWGDVKAAFRWWAEQLRERLDELKESDAASSTGS